MLLIAASKLQTQYSISDVPLLHLYLLLPLCCINVPLLHQCEQQHVE
jgi:hypothetical protein